MNRLIYIIGLLFILSACHGEEKFRNPPVLADGEAVTWHYNCNDRDSGLNVEYANMGGEYSATIIQKEYGKRVLPQIEQGRFSDGDWLWQIDSDNYFTLSQDSKVISHSCRAYNVVRTDGIILLR